MSEVEGRCIPDSYITFSLSAGKYPRPVGVYILQMFRCPVKVFKNLYYPNPLHMMDTHMMEKDNFRRVSQLTTGFVVLHLQPILTADELETNIFKLEMLIILFINKSR